MSNTVSEGLVITVDGEVKLRLPATALEIRGNQVWHKQMGIPLINGKAAGADIDDIKRLMQAKDGATIAAKYPHAIHILGENGNAWIGTEREWHFHPAQVAAREKRLAKNCKCERCKKHVDGRTAYKQMEKTRFGAAVVSVIAYYCEDCHHMLGQIGAGEHTALQERAGEVPSYEPTHPED